MCVDLGAGSCLSGLALAPHLGHSPVQLPAPPEAAVQGACLLLHLLLVGKLRQDQVKVRGTEDPHACEQGAQDGPEGHPHTDFPFSKCTPDTPPGTGPSPPGPHTSGPLLQLGLYLEPNSYNLDGRQRDWLQTGGLCPRKTATLHPPGSLTSERPRRVPLSHCPATRSWKRPGRLA